MTTTIREAALESVAEALGSADASLGRAGRPRRQKKTRTARKVRVRRGGRRSTSDVDAVGNAVLAEVRSNPGASVSEIASALGYSTKDLQLPIRKLVAERHLRTTGQRRGTRYHPGGGRRATKKRAKRKGSRKKRTTARRKTSSGRARQTAA